MLNFYDVKSFIQAVYYYARPSVSVGSHEYLLVDKLAEVAKSFLLQHYHTWIAARTNVPIIAWYSSDCTPIKTRELHSWGTGGMKVHRSGKRTDELLIQRFFVSDADRSVCTYFTDPLHMEDKTASSHVQAWLDLASNPRSLGHQSLFTSWSVFDGALVSALARMTKQYYEGLHHRNKQLLAAGDALRLRLCTFVFVFKCAAHHFHSALDWSMRPYTSKEILKCYYVTIESLRNGFNELVSHLGSWLTVALRYEDSISGVSIELWLMIGLEQKYIDIVVDLQLRYEHPFLKCKESCATDAGLIDKITTLMLRLWKFRRFSDGRWVGSGPSCRSFIGALMMGLNGLVVHILADSTSSHYYLRGYNYLNPQVLKFVAITAVSSTVSERALGLLLKDDRLPMQLGTIDDAINQAVATVQAFGKDIWDAVAACSGLTGTVLRDACVRSACLQLSFIESYVRQARRAPMDLLQGDRNQNLNQLMVSGKPLEENAGKLWDLLQLGWPRHDILQNMELWWQASWSAKITEDAHVSASGTMRFHSELTRKNLQSRSVVAQFRPLVSTDAVAAKVSKISGRLAKLDAKRPHRFTGRQALVSQLVSTAKASSYGTSHGMRKVSKTVFKKHGALWKQLSTKRRKQLDEVAAKRCEEKKVVIRGMQTCLRKQRDDLMIKQAAEKSGGVLTRMTACKLNPVELQSIVEFFNSPDWTPDVISGLRADACCAVQPLCKSASDFIGSFNVASNAPSNATPDWFAFVAKHRVFFENSLLRIEREGAETSFYAFAYASQNPILVALVGLEAFVRPLPLVTAHSLNHEAWQLWRYRFLYTYDVEFSDDGGFHGEYQGSVLPDALNIGNHKVASDAE